MWSGRHVVVGVSGGIACYKSCYLVRRLVEAGARVDVVLTRNAAEFVRPITFEALSGRPVLSSLWEPGGALAHVRLGQEPDLLIIAPATANLLARVAHGMADDFLTAVLLARTIPALLAPAMNDAMYAASATQANIALLRDRGYAVVGPEIGPLAEGPSDHPGRMSEPDAILRHGLRILRARGPLAGKRVLITAGSTRESIDPVRVISNRSSGKMGFRLAEAAWLRGAEVVLVSGPSSEVSGPEISRRPVESVADLKREVAAQLPTADVLIMAAAPADFTVVAPEATKRPRQGGPITLVLEATEDVLASTRDLRKPGAFIVGFALETGDANAKARAKLERKGLDLIVANDALEPGAGFEVDTNHVTILDRSGIVGTFEGTKSEVAEGILDVVEARLGH